MESAIPGPKDQKKSLSTADLMEIALFTALTAIGAFIRIPVPVCPFTLQFLFTMLAGLLLGPEKGAFAVGLYTLLGLFGVPIFTEGGGLWYIFKPTFGYILGFIIASYVTGKMAGRSDHPKFSRLLLANYTGMAIVYLAGIVWYYVICNYVINTPIGLWPVILYCGILAAPGDILLCLLAAVLTRRIRPALSHMGL